MLATQFAKQLRDEAGDTAKVAKKRPRGGRSVGLENVCVNVIGACWPRARFEGSTPVNPETSSPHQPVIFAARAFLANVTL